MLKIRGYTNFLIKLWRSYNRGVLWHLGGSVPIQSCSPGYQGSNLAATARQRVLVAPILLSSSLLESPTSKPTRLWAGIADLRRYNKRRVLGPARPPVSRIDISHRARACTARAPPRARASIFFLKNRTTVLGNRKPPMMHPGCTDPLLKNTAVVHRGLRSHQYGRNLFYYGRARASDTCCIQTTYW